MQASNILLGSLVISWNCSSLKLNQVEPVQISDTHDGPNLRYTRWSKISDTQIRMIVQISATQIHTLWYTDTHDGPNLRYTDTHDGRNLWHTDTHDGPNLWYTRWWQRSYRSLSNRPMCQRTFSNVGSSNRWPCRTSACSRSPRPDRQVPKVLTDKIKNIFDA